MNQQEAEGLLIDTFNREFNSDKFVNFLKELLKGKFNINPKSSSPHKEFEEYIRSFKKIGDYKNGRNSIEILIVELKKTSSLERARTMQRNFIAKWLNSDYSPKDGALVAFYGENPDDWRFSFVKMDYKFGEDGQVIKELTPAKRYSFLVGKHEPNHTCKRQFLSLLKEETVPPTLEELEKAFSVDNVTKEFFDQYKDRFIQLKESIDGIIKKNHIVRKEFENKGINSIEFSKKLLGQIVFLYFLQKKGWLGVQKDSGGKFNEWGSGPKDFMKRLFNGNIVKYENFFNDVLEPLFYQALANDRSADNDYYEKLKCKVPFLNGGLFEPIKDYDWTKTDILIDNNIFKDIFTTFDQFNFTIKEDEPLEKEVAVDPEMLGKVFENLLDVNDRKSKGAFYTPREIVHYMCQQSLINYLETNTLKLGIKREEIELFILKGDIALDRLRRIHLGKYDDVKLILPKSIVSNYKELDKLLREIKICDPAVGSGAFPVGMMNEIIKARNILTYFYSEKEKVERTDYNLKRQTIENSLYGVDIESSAVEITKLRFWLSLIVDELDMKNIRPLPNLDNRIMCGNSLIEEFEGVKLFDERLTNGKSSKQMTLFKKGSEYKLETLQKLQSIYFNEQDRNKKKRLMKDIENLEWEFIEVTLKEQGNEDAMKKLDQYKNSRSKPFFLWKLYFSDVFQRDNPGFDVVIANPPYVRQEEIKEYKDSLSKEYKISNGTADLYCYFLELAFNLSKQEGSSAYITSNKFLRTSYGKELRGFLKENTSIRQLINFGGYKVFDATVDTMITIFKKVYSPSNKVGIVNIKEDFQIKDSIDNYIHKNMFYFEQRYLNNEGWALLDEKGFKLKMKIELNSSLKEKGYKIFRGVTTGANSVFLADRNKISEFNLEKSILKPILQGQDIYRYSHKKNKYFMIYSKIGFEINDFPNTKKYLYDNKEILSNVWEAKNGKKKFYELRGCKYYNEFSKEKIIWCDISDYPSFTFDKREHYFLLNTAFMILGEHLEYVLSILNSKLSYYWFKNTSSQLGESGIRFIPEFVERFPLKLIEKSKQKPFVELVERILSITDDEDYLKNPEKQAIVKALEKRIDKMVYDLYELTPEEIKIVEEFSY
ncbi:MAG: Eco57I restriction-modification methylase domain-containing protein [Candidatus Nanoarchaeia archaeon]|nr:Eco57I restriction-modification methylase domain-containing protein [Candidatus Nanoarchaeia archaeon]MDD5741515.1 Eco57I restriction-modification methylase domain-containing protein [Candidatus Nanoarchaeia archaeon]